MILFTVRALLSPCKRYLCLGVCMAALLQGCAGRYFHDVVERPGVPPRYTMDGLPVHEYWTGVVFNGNKIGFTHFAVTPSAREQDCFEIRSQAFMRFRFLMVDKSISLVSWDLVDKDLHLKRFSCEYEVDGARLKLSGSLEGETLKVVRVSGSASAEEHTEVRGELYPGSVIYLYPLLHGLETGKRYDYRIYDSEAQGISEVSQEVLAYQKSELFSGNAYKVRTRYQGQEVNTWLDHKGLPVLEMALGGVLISGIENEEQARRYLVESSLNKNEDLLEFSLIKVKSPIKDPFSVEYMEVFLDGVPEGVSIPSEGCQECRQDGQRVQCRIRSAAPGKDSCLEVAGHAPEIYLKPSHTVPSTSREIQKTAKEIAGKSVAQDGQIRAILAWMEKNIAKEPVDVFTALDVLLKKKAECQGHAYLYTAFARSLGIPTRIVNGLVYSKEFKGFLYHAWAESFTGGEWITVDPTLNQMPADATHIKLVEGETLASLIPMVGLMGKIGVEVVEIK